MKKQILIAIIAGLIVGTLVWAWSEPTVAPPGGNVYVPLNTGPGGQSKEGGLILNTGGATNGLIVSSGRVGIGTSATTQSLTINGNLDMLNGKIYNVSEIDPVFDFGGVKYVTYLPDSIGQKIEVVGQAKVNEQLIIDLENESIGSDLWLFWKAVDKESVIPFVSPQGDFDTYSYISGNDFIIYGEGIVSYRLIGTRIDHKGEDNLYHDQDTKYFIDLNQYE